MNKTLRVLCLVAVFMVAAGVTMGCASLTPEAMVQANGGPEQGVDGDGVLRVMTVNLAHGRADGAHQIFLSPEEITANLGRVARLVGERELDVVAFQEADGPSGWSGRFCHVDYLAREAGYGWYLRGEHVAGMGLSYGTALMARRNLVDPYVHTFTRTGPGPAKGFTVSTVEVGGQAVDVVSVHLDFNGEASRYGQIRQMVEVLRGRERPLVLMGDLNTEWRSGTLQYLREELGLFTYRPEAVDLATYGDRRRIDWVLATEEFEFVRHEVLEDVVSDHRPVAVELRLRGQGDVEVASRR